MTSYSNIDDEAQLEKMLENLDDMQERKKIRARLRELQEKKLKEWEQKRLENERLADQAIKDKVKRADEEKARALQQFKDNANMTKNMEDLRLKASQAGLKDRQRMADEEKQRKLEAFNQLAAGGRGSKTSVTTTTTTDTSGDGTKTTVIKKTQTVTKTVTGSEAGGMAAKPGLAAPTKPVSRSPSAIKQMLLEWTKAMTQEYADKVVITNFSSSWSNGLAFCALIHHFYPEAFDFNALDPKKRRHNFDLAFNTAEKYADIAPLLDTDDMVRMAKPDWKCVFTYVQSFYRKLAKHERNKVIPKE
ncbi:uncharacterized protein LOC115224761 isoform X34 [Argonauta hians]